MRKKQILVIVGVLVAIEVLVCAAIVAVLVSSRFALPDARFFYVADTRAQEIVEESFVTDGPVKLDLTNTNGDVEIVAGDGSQIVVKATKEVWGQDKSEAKAKLQALEVKMAMDGDTLRVRVDDPDENATIVFGSIRSSRVRFEIAVPSRTAVVVHTRNANITLKGTEGDADLTSRYGSIVVEETLGSVIADTNNGDVTVRRSGSEQAAIDLHSHYGNITVREVTAGELALDSNNGALDLEEVTVDNDLVLNTHYGKIDLQGARAGSLTAKSQNGDIVLNDGQLEGGLDLFAHYGAVSVARTEASAYKIETNNGDIKLDGGYGSLWIHSHYGDIVVKNARDVTLDLNTRNGEVTFEGSLADQGDHDIESHYGAVSLRLPPDTAVFLDASTRYGSIRCEFDVLVEGSDEGKEKRASGDELRGTINGGSDNLRVETNNGDVTIETEPSK
jgi:DUF4097 and DUF4098 domain-containing protein YvlB